MTGAGNDIALRLRQILIDLSPHIEEYTAAVCPECTDICCRQRHRLYSERDIGYLHGLGIPVPVRDEGRSLDGPCECMGPHGCIQPRWMRPFKCTWYFCEPLLAALNSGPQKKARNLSKMMQDALDLYDVLSECQFAGQAVPVNETIEHYCAPRMPRSKQ
jgi:hypothetical protein